MALDSLITGRIYGAPVSRTAQNGNRFVTAKVRVPMRDGEVLFANVICFSATPCDGLLALGDGDSVAISGECSVKVWTNAHGESKPQLDVVAHAVLTAFHVSRKRKVVAGANDETEEVAA